MKKKFVKTTLTLSLLLMAAAPTQAFAGTDCESTASVPLNQQVVIKNLNGNLANNAWLNNIVKQNSTGKVTVTTSNSTQSGSKNQSTPQTVTKTPSTQQTTTEKQTTNTAQTTTQNKSTNTTTNTNTSTTQAVGSYEKQVADLVNKERAAAGLKPLTLSAEISKVAELKAEDMRDKNYFSHTSPTYGSPFDMMKQFGVQYSTAGENIAKGQKTPESVMNGWMNSAGHKANILSANYGKIGVGYVTDSSGNTYWVQMFTN